MGGARSPEGLRCGGAMAGKNTNSMKQGVREGILLPRDAGCRGGLGSVVGDDGGLRCFSKFLAGAGDDGGGIGSTTDSSSYCTKNCGA